VTHPRRQALASTLRAARETTGLRQQQFADRLGWHQTKVARFENGRRLPSEADLAAWAQATGHDVTEWLPLLEATRDYSVLVSEAAKTPGGIVAEQAELQALEEASTLVAEYQPLLIPGLAQTADYAYQWLTQPGRPDAPAGTDWQAVVDARVARQDAVLHDPHRRVVVAVNEAALWAVYGTETAHRDQLEHLVALGDAGTVELIVAPRRPTLAVMSGFELLDDIVSLETGQGLKVLAYPDVLDQYRAALAAMRAVAAVGERAVALVGDVAARLGQ
jgi:transcriptional regulator with XRE-family HTH domain